MTIAYNLIYDNVCDGWGGGVCADGCTLNIFNNTIVQNECNYSGSGIFAINGSYFGENNIIWGNVTQYGSQYYGTINFNYSCCSTALTGIGNITDNPMFVDTTNNDFHLQEGSPCIDTGDPASPLDPDSTRADMGALYFDQSAPQIELPISALVFDTTMVMEYDTLSFIAANIGSADLIIYDIHCNLPDVFSIGWNPEDTLITPGSELEIEVVFAPQEAMLYLDEITIENNDEESYVSLEGLGIPFNSVDRKGTNSPCEFALLPAYPNPFNPSTVLSFELPDASFVELIIYDIQGREVARLMDGFRSAGVHEAVFDGGELASGVYFAKLTAVDYQQTQKLLLIK